MILNVFTSEISKYGRSQMNRKLPPVKIDYHADFFKMYYSLIINSSFR